MTLQWLLDPEKHSLAFPELEPIRADTPSIEAVSTIYPQNLTPTHPNTIICQVRKFFLESPPQRAGNLMPFAYHPPDRQASGSLNGNHIRPNCPDPRVVCACLLEGHPCYHLDRPMLDAAGRPKCNLEEVCTKQVSHPHPLLALTLLTVPEMFGLWMVLQREISCTSNVHLDHKGRSR